MDDKPNINCRCSFWKEYADTFIKQPDQTTFPGDGTTFSGQSGTSGGRPLQGAMCEQTHLVGFWEILKNQPSSLNRVGFLLCLMGGGCDGAVTGGLSGADEGHPR